MTLKTLMRISFLCFLTKKLALECELYDLTCQVYGSAGSVNSSCKSLEYCHDTPEEVPACYALFKRNNQDELSVVKKGCVQTKAGPDCRSSSICSVRKRSTHKVPSTSFYCCCTKDRCNRDVVLFVTEEQPGKCGDIQESLRKLTLLLWAQVITLGMVSGLTATAWFTYKLIYVRRRSLSPQVHSVKGAHRFQNPSQWTKKDFKLITCLVQSKFGEIWQARPHGSNQVVRIRLTAGSDDVYVYDRHLVTKNTKTHLTGLF